MASDTSSIGTRDRVKVIVAKDAMSASLLIRKPGKDDPPITEDEIRKELVAAEVVYGVNDSVVREIVAEQRYNVPIKVADGLMPEKGHNAVFTYHFNTTEQHQPKVDEFGNVDYKEISFIQNCEAGTVLVTKTPPTIGNPGMTIHHKEILGPIGRDLSFNNGANTTITDGGLSLVAAKSGVIQFLNGKVSIVDVVMINSDVDFSVGNIDCRGSVRVKGDVKAGFELTVDGDLEVSGNVEDCKLHVKGNIFVKGGFYGEGAGAMEAEGDIVLKYAEGQRISCGHNLTVAGEIINCQVTTKEKVAVTGKRGKIVGGEIRAGKEIRAAVLGSPAGTSTRLTVGYNADLFAQFFHAVHEIARITKDGERVKNALAGLARLEMLNKLPPVKRETMAKLQLFLDDLPESLRVLEEEKAEVEAKLKELSDARIVADEIIHPGVRASFGLVYRDFVQDEKHCTLRLDGNQVIQV